jgi:hypothetical protein
MISRRQPPRASIGIAEKVRRRFRVLEVASAQWRAQGEQRSAIAMSLRGRSHSAGRSIREPAVLLLSAVILTGRTPSLT